MDLRSSLQVQIEIHHNNKLNTQKLISFHLLKDKSHLFGSIKLSGNWICVSHVPTYHSLNYTTIFILDGHPCAIFDALRKASRIVHKVQTGWVSWRPLSFTGRKQEFHLSSIEYRKLTQQNMANKGLHSIKRNPFLLHMVRQKVSLFLVFHMHKTTKQMSFPWSTWLKLGDLSLVPLAKLNSSMESTSQLPNIGL